MARVVIFGCGQGADTAFRYLSRDSAHEMCGFTVDAAFKREPSFHGLPVVEYESVTERFPPEAYQMFVPLGFQQMNRLRAAKYLDAKAKGYRFVSYVNSRHYSLEGLTVGENCLILDNQIFNLDVSIGDNVTIWSGNHIGDRTVIGSHVWISSHVTLSGDVRVGDYCFLGVNAAVSNRITLAPRTFVGASVLVARDTAEGSVHVAPSPTVVPMASERFLSMLKIT
jgi:sugar O-acyltransferase (sialic acid O-acetyltransferase NeuD family)